MSDWTGLQVHVFRASCPTVSMLHASTDGITPPFVVPGHRVWPGCFVSWTDTDWGGGLGEIDRLDDRTFYIFDAALPYIQAVLSEAALILNLANSSNWVCLNPRLWLAIKLFAGHRSLPSGVAARIARHATIAFPTGIDRLDLSCHALFAQLKHPPSQLVDPK